MNQNEKSFVFRVPEPLKRSFKMALLRHDIDIQHTFEAFCEIFISHDGGRAVPDAIYAIVKRSKELKG